MPEVESDAADSTEHPHAWLSTTVSKICMNRQDISQLLGLAPADGFLTYELDMLGQAPAPRHPAPGTEMSPHNLDHSQKFSRSAHKHSLTCPQCFQLFLGTVSEIAFIIGILICMCCGDGCDVPDRIHKNKSVYAGACPGR